MWYTDTFGNADWPWICPNTTEIKVSDENTFLMSSVLLCEQAALFDTAEGTQPYTDTECKTNTEAYDVVNDFVV